MLFTRRRRAVQAAEELTADLADARAEAAALASENEALRRHLAEVQGKDTAELVLDTARLRVLWHEADDALHLKAEQAAEALHADLEAEGSRLREEARAEAEELVASARAEVDTERRILATHVGEIGAATSRLADINEQADRAREQLTNLRRRIVATDEIALLQEAGIYRYRHPLADAIAYKAELARLNDDVKTMVKSNRAVLAATTWHVNGSLAEGRKMVRDFSKLMLRAYNAEADYAVRSMRPYRLTSMVDRLDKTRQTIARLGATMQIRISDEYHRLRVYELELCADHLAKQDEEKERRRELRAQQREEERLAREIERERARLEKERQHYRSALERLLSTDSAAPGAGALRDRLTEIDSAMAAVDARAANVRAGYVYVISNVGAFGENMVKIGLTRRLEPMDRIHELGDASVPFRFDVHALIFSEDAVGLERRLHQEFENSRVNRVNPRREFFYTRPAEVRAVLQRIAGQHLLEFHEDFEASEWRASTAAADHGRT